MSASKTLASWTALPATFISMLIASKLLTALVSPKDKGLIAVSKAITTFLIVLALTSAALHMLSIALSHDQDNTLKNNRPKSLAEELQGTDFSDTATLLPAPSDDRVAAWRNRVLLTHDEPHSALASYRKEEENAQLGTRDRKKLQKKKDAEQKKERKMIWKALVKEFKPKRSSLLGPRKETMVEVEMETETEEEKHV